MAILTILTHTGMLPIAPKALFPLSGEISFQSAMMKSVFMSSMKRMALRIKQTMITVTLIYFALFSQP